MLGGVGSLLRNLSSASWMVQPPTDMLRGWGCGRGRQREWDGLLRSAVEAFWGAGIYQLLQYGWGHNYGGLQSHRGVQALTGGPQGLALSMMGEIQKSGQRSVRVLFLE